LHFTADIEFEYRVPEDSDFLTEMAMYIAYRRDVLA